MIRFIFIIITLVFLLFYNPRQIASQTQETLISPVQQTVSLEPNAKIVTGQIVYVPVYSHIYHQNRQTVFPLSITLSIRNTDISESLTITSVRYYDSLGNLVQEYLESPIQLNKLASLDFFIDRNDTKGGSGANFIVEWIAYSEVTEPLIEAIMIGTDAQQGISFVGQGRVVKTLPE